MVTIMVINNSHAQDREEGTRFETALFSQQALPSNLKRTRQDGTGPPSFVALGSGSRDDSTPRAREGVRREASSQPTEKEAAKKRPREREQTRYNPSSRPKEGEAKTKESSAEARVREDPRPRQKERKDFQFQPRHTPTRIQSTDEPKDGFSREDGRDVSHRPSPQPTFKPPAEQRPSRGRPGGQRPPRRERERDDDFGGQRPPRRERERDEDSGAPPAATHMLSEWLDLKLSLKSGKEEEGEGEGEWEEVSGTDFEIWESEEALQRREKDREQTQKRDGWRGEADESRGRGGGGRRGIDERPWERPREEESGKWGRGRRRNEERGGWQGREEGNRRERWRDEDIEDLQGRGEGHWGERRRNDEGGDWQGRREGNRREWRERRHDDESGDWQGRRGDGNWRERRRDVEMEDGQGREAPAVGPRDGCKEGERRWRGEGGRGEGGGGHGQRSEFLTDHAANTDRPSRGRGRGAERPSEGGRGSGPQRRREDVTDMKPRAPPSMQEQGRGSGEAAGGYDWGWVTGLKSAPEGAVRK